MMRMKKGYKLNWTVPLVLFLAVIIDASLPSIFPMAFLGNKQVITSHVFLYFVVLFAFYFRYSNILMSAFIMGLFYDMYNTLVLGMNASLYLLMAYLVIKSKKYFPKKAYIHFIFFMICIFFLDVLTYLFYLEINVATSSMLDFMVNRLTPTLIFNTVLTIILYYPSKQFLRWLGYRDFIVI